MQSATQTGTATRYRQVINLIQIIAIINRSQASTAGYGPDDFIVETVNLDKNFFYQFFTSKPMIIDTDVVTSTSVKVRQSGDKNI